MVPVHTPSSTNVPPADSSSLNQSIIDILDKLVESKTSKVPTNLSFPPFSGTKDSINFHRWSTIVCEILSTSKRRKLYDEGKQTYVKNGEIVPILNNHLYSALLVKLKGPAADYAASRRDLHGDEIALVEDLRLSYRTVLTPVEFIYVGNKFNNHSRKKDQAIESFVTELESLQHDILDNGRGFAHPTPSNATLYLIWDQTTDGSPFSDPRCKKIPPISIVHSSAKQALQRGT